jgi:hypothetical protein
MLEYTFKYHIVLQWHSGSGEPPLGSRMNEPPSQILVLASCNTLETPLLLEPCCNTTCHEDKLSKFDMRYVGKFEQ